MYGMWSPQAGSKVDVLSLIPTLLIVGLGIMLLPIIITCLTQIVAPLTYTNGRRKRETTSNDTPMPLNTNFMLGLLNTLETALEKFGHLHWNYPQFINFSFAIYIPFVITVLAFSFSSRFRNFLHFSCSLKKTCRWWTGEKGHYSKHKWQQEYPGWFLTDWMKGATECYSRNKREERSWWHSTYAKEADSLSFQDHVMKDRGSLNDREFEIVKRETLMKLLNRRRMWWDNIFISLSEVLFFIGSLVLLCLERKESITNETV